jgi:SAM domain (Sterile alpha motif)
VLPELTVDDRISIGVTSAGHRRKLLAAIAALGAKSLVLWSRRHPAMERRKPMRNADS